MFTTKSRRKFGDIPYAVALRKITGIKLINAEKSHFSLNIQLENELFNKKVVLYFPYDKPKTLKEKSRYLSFNAYSDQKLELSKFVQALASARHNILSPDK